MNILTQMGFNLLINALEAFLIYLLFSKKLSFQYSARIVFACFAFQALSVTIMNQFLSLDSLRMTLTLIIDVCIALFLSADFSARTVFWGCAYPLITVLADSITVLSGRLFIRGDWNSLLEYPISIIMTFIYLFVCFFCVLTLISLPTTEFVIPWFIQATWFIATIAGIVSAELLLDLAVQVKMLSLQSSNRLVLSVLFLLILLFFSIMLFYYIGILYEKNLKLTEANRQKQFEKQQFELLNATNSMLKTWKHDMHHHLSTLEIMLQEQESVREYLDEIHMEMEDSAWQIHTGNQVLDAVLTSKYIKIQMENIHFSHSIFLPSILPLGNLELTSLMGNLLDNAIEACAELTPGMEKYIILEMKPYNSFLCIDVANSSNGNYRYDLTKKLVSTKRDGGHGVGLKRIEQIISEADGFFRVSPEKERFRITIMLPFRGLEEERPDKT